MLMPGRKFTAGNVYRYGFNGKENDNDVKGEGNQQNYGMRIYDPRIGRFLSVDPLTKSYPHYTPYSFAGNKPIQFIDLDGAEEQKHWWQYTAVDLLEWIRSPTNPVADNGFVHKAATAANRSLNPGYNASVIIFGEETFSPASDTPPITRMEAAFNLTSQLILGKLPSPFKSNPGAVVEQQLVKNEAAMGSNGASKSVNREVEAGDQNVTKSDVSNPVATRRTPIESEKKFTPDGPGEVHQPKFKSGAMIPSNTKGHVKPESYNFITGNSTEVKNFTFAANGTADKRSIKGLVDQITQRQSHLPAGSTQTIIMDIKGQNVSILQQMKFRNEVLTQVRTPGVTIVFKTF